MGMLSFPIAISVDGLSHRICVCFSRNLSWVLSHGKGVEAKERANFVELTAIAGCRHLYDIGANVGLYAFTFNSAGTGRRVSMFEPDPTNAELLQRTLRRFAVQNCELVQAAVSDTDGMLTFHTDLVSGATGSIREGDSFLSHHHQGETTPMQVRSVSLDRFGEDCGSDPDVIKIDAEGAELSIFRGAETLLRRSRPMLLFECDRDKSEISADLKAKGYKFFDAITLEPVDQPAHNCFALHLERHSIVIDALGRTLKGPQ
jgi:FkbM family methyltransferase